MVYCCSREDVLDSENHFSIHRPLDGRRRFRDLEQCFLKIAVIHGKILFAGEEEIIDWCRSEYAQSDAEWFFEAKNLRKIDNRLCDCGYIIEAVHPFFISETPTRVDTSGYDIRWYEAEDIGQFRGNDRFNEAYAFCEDAPDILGVAALRNGQIIGMAGASYDSPAMWQIGINVDPLSRSSGVGQMLVGLLKNAILERGALPFYGTSLSHIASQRLALGAGFVPAWAELVTSRKGVVK